MTLIFNWVLNKNGNGVGMYFFFKQIHLCVLVHFSCFICSSLGSVTCDCECVVCASVCMCVWTFKTVMKMCVIIWGNLITERTKVLYSLSDFRVGLDVVDSCLSELIGRNKEHFVDWNQVFSRVMTHLKRCITTCLYWGLLPFRSVLSNKSLT